MYTSHLQDWTQYEEKIRQKIETFIYRKKSQKEIQMLLQGQFPYFSEEIKEILPEYNDNSSFDFYVQKYAIKYNTETFE